MIVTLVARVTHTNGTGMTDCLAVAVVVVVVVVLVVVVVAVVVVVVVVVPWLFLLKWSSGVAHGPERGLVWKGVGWASS